MLKALFKWGKAKTRIALAQPNNSSETALPADAHQDGVEFALCDNPGFSQARSDLVIKISGRMSPLVVTGESGIGKSLLIQKVIGDVGEDVHPILLSYPRFEFDEVFRLVAGSLGRTESKDSIGQSVEQELDSLRHWFEEELREGRYVTLFIDDAQDFSEDVLINLLQLSQVSLDNGSLSGLVLVGLPRLEEKLRRMQLSELLSDDRYCCRLLPLKPDEIEAFIRTHLVVAGAWHDDLFAPEAVALIGALSRGIPRLINALCRAAISTGKTRSEQTITTETVEEAARSCSLALGTDGHLVCKVEGPENVVSRPPSDIEKTQADRSDQKEVDTRVGREDLDRESVPSSAQKLLPLSATPDPRPEGDDQEEVDPEKQVSAAFHGCTATENLTTKSSGQLEKPIYRTENLNEVLKSLQTGSPNLKASALISEDGLMIASALPQDLDETRVAGMSATLLSLGARGAAELGRGDVQEVVVRGMHGYTVMVNAGHGVLLLVVAKEDAKLGLVFFDMQEAINEIQRIL